MFRIVFSELVLGHQNERGAMTPLHTATKRSCNRGSSALQKHCPHLGRSSQPVAPKPSLKQLGWRQEELEQPAKSDFNCSCFGSSRKANRNSHYDIFKNKSLYITTPSQLNEKVAINNGINSCPRCQYDHRREKLGSSRKSSGKPRLEANENRSRQHCTSHPTSLPHFFSLSRPTVWCHKRGGKVF